MSFSFLVSLLIHLWSHSCPHVIVYPYKPIRILLCTHTIQNGLNTNWCIFTNPYKEYFKHNEKSKGLCGEEPHLQNTGSLMVLYLIHFYWHNSLFLDQTFFCALHKVKSINFSLTPINASTSGSWIWCPTCAQHPLNVAAL